MILAHGVDAIGCDQYAADGQVFGGDVSEAGSGKT